ncbi:MAG: ABC transporter substrate-binding protein [Burkholderiaceae bacterium]
MRIFAALVGAALLSTSAYAQTAIKFALDWRFEGPAAPYFVAIDKGYYKAEGLDVSIDPGAGSVEGINRVASGVYQMGFADINSLIKYRDNPANSPIKAVMMGYDTPAFAIITLKKTGISKPKDLEGRILGAPAPDGAYAQWPIFVDANKIDASKVKIENVGFPVREPMLAQSNPKAVAGFVRATIKGIQDTIASPETAIDSLMKRNQIAKRDVELERLKLAISKNFVTPDVKKNGFGDVDMARLARSIDQIGLTFKYTNKPKAQDIFTSEFLPAKDARAVK